MRRPKRQTTFTQSTTGISQGSPPEHQAARGIPLLFARFRFRISALLPVADYELLPSENRNKVLNAVPRILSNTLRNPCNISDLLFLQPKVRVEHRVLELLQKREFVEVHFRLEESV